jgi:hypothetical protein
MHTYEMILFTDNLAANRVALADGVTGETCTYAGGITASPLTAGERQIATDTAPAVPVAYLSSVECYANGAHNVYVRDHHTEMVIGFVRVRPVLALAA